MIRAPQQLRSPARLLQAEAVSGVGVKAFDPYHLHSKIFQA